MSNKVGAREFEQGAHEGARWLDLNDISDWNGDGVAGKWRIGTSSKVDLGK